MSRRLFAAITVLLAVAGNAASAQEHKTYRCKVADLVGWRSGHLRPESYPKALLRKLFDGIIIDTMTGAVTYNDSSGVHWWSVGQRPVGESRHDYVLTLVGPAMLLPGITSAETLSAGADAFIRIRTRDPYWPALRDENPPVFLAFWADDFVSGPCEVVR